MENFETFKLDQTGQQTQEILDQVSTNTADIAQLRALYEALTQSEPVIIQPSDTWPVADPEENVIYRVIDRVNTPPQSYSDYMWNGTAMVLMATYNNAIDNEPTPGSNNLVKSGGVAASIVFDISAYHATGSTLATYANLAAALGTDGANVPASVRKGGMSVKFVKSSDNKYVQYRLTNQTFTTYKTDWQSVDNEVDYLESAIINKGISGINFDRINILDFAHLVGATVYYNSNLKWPDSTTKKPVIWAGDDIVIDFAWNNVDSAFIDEMYFTKGTSTQALINYTENVDSFNSEYQISGYISHAVFSFERMVISISASTPYILIKANYEEDNTAHDITHWIKNEDLKNASVNKRTLASDVFSYIEERIFNKSILSLKFDRISVDDFARLTGATIYYNSALTGYNTTTYLPVISSGNDIIIDFIKNDVTDEFINSIKFTKGESSQGYIKYTENVTAFNWAGPITDYINLFEMGEERMAINVSSAYPFILIKADLTNDNNLHTITHWIKPEDLSDDITINVSVGIFSSMAVIGDSYAEGAIVKANEEWAGVGAERTWIAQICKRNGIASHNYGVGGMSTRSYLESWGFTSVLADDPWDFYMFALGINDEWSLGINYLGSISDITSDYHNNPDTFYGNYARIIEQVMAHAPNARFCMVKLQNIGTYHEQFNSAIANIAEHYSIPVIDPFDDAFFNSPTYLQMVGGHPTLLGYSGMSLAYERLLSKCFVANPVYFRYAGIN